MGKKYDGPERRASENGVISKLVVLVAGALIVAALLGNYAYTREGRVETRAEIARVEDTARRERDRAYDQLTSMIAQNSIKLDRLIERGR